MSGRDNSSSSSGNSGPAYSSSCDALRFDLQLSSPQAPVVATLSVGDVLLIAVVQMQGLVIVQALSNGQPAGGLTGPEATMLRNCIDKGHNYTATVLQITSGQVRVRVEHA